MIRRLSYLLLSALLLTGCNRESLEWDGPYIEITLSSDDSLETKAETGIYTQEGVDRLHENLISTIDFFFYPDGKTDEDAVYHVQKQSGKNKSDLIRLGFTSEQINNLIFPTQGGVTKCTVFAVVNYKGDSPLVQTDGQGKDILTGTSLPELQRINVLTGFVYPEQTAENPTSTGHYHDKFMMSGMAVLTLRGRSQALSAVGTINLERYACKMTVGVNVVPQVVVGNEVWEPMLESMEIYLVEAVENVTLGGRSESPSYFSFRSNPMKFTDLNGDLLFEKDGNYLNTYPFYMYPQKWKYGSTLSPNKEPYLKLVLPWKRVEGGGYTQKQFYYKIIIPDDHREEYARQFVRNNWYHIAVDVSILGAETDEDVVPVTGSVYVVYWQDKNIVIKNAEIGKARYLAIDRDQYTLYNIPATTAPYVSSHPVILKDLSVTRIYFGTKGVGTYTLGGTVKEAGSDDIYPSGTKYLLFDVRYDQESGKGYYHYKENNVEKTEVWLENTGMAIELNHTLNNNYKDPAFDYTPYRFQYTLVHVDHPEDPLYRQTQTIIQYPAIYLDRTVNPDNIIESGDGYAEHHGYVYVNGEQYLESDYDSDGKKTENLWRVVTYHGKGTDMFKISTTVLPGDSEFVIGDPRVSSPTYIREYCTDRAIEGGERTLKWYYPTDETDRTVNMIAPSYRISTKLSGTYRNTEINKTQARYRCAAFQENGFPAGRWRLPTEAEVSFSAQLSGNGVFASQFDNNYWSANGVVNVDKNGVVTPQPTKTTAFIRCVYDSWYWGDERVVDSETGMPSVFIWGDVNPEQ